MIGHIGAMPQLYETPGRLSAAQLPSARRLWHSRQEMLLDSRSLGGAVLLGLQAMPTTTRWQHQLQAAARAAIGGFEGTIG